MNSKYTSFAWLYMFYQQFLPGSHYEKVYTANALIWL